MTATIRPHLPVSDIDPFERDVRENPWDMHALLRDAGPVVYLSRYDVYAMARYEQVSATLIDWQRFASSAGVGMRNLNHEKHWQKPSLLLEADPPRHDAPRAVLKRVLGPQALRKVRDEWFAAARDLVDEVITEREFDAVEHLAERFVLRVFPDAVGVSGQGREHLLPYGNFVSNSFGPRNELVKQLEPDIGEHLAWITRQCARETLSPNGFGAQIWAACDHYDLTPEQAPLVVRSLLTAGVDNPTIGIATALYAFTQYPQQWQRVRANPALARTAFDEAMRWRSPAQTFFRTTTEDIDIGDTVIPRDHKVMLFLGAANRDPRRWADPDHYDLSRDPSGHVGFSMGIHHCVGQHVARLEAEALLTALASRVESFELIGPIRIRPNNSHLALSSVPMRIRLAS